MEILLPWLLGQLQVTTMPRNPLVSANGNANDHASQLRQLQGTLVVTILRWVSEDGQWKWR